MSVSEKGEAFHEANGKIFPGMSDRLVCRFAVHPSVPYSCGSRYPSGSAGSDDAALPDAYRAGSVLPGMRRHPGGDPSAGRASHSFFFLSSRGALRGRAGRLVSDFQYHRLAFPGPAGQGEPLPSLVWNRSRRSGSLQLGDPQFSASRVSYHIPEAVSSGCRMAAEPGSQLTLSP